MIRALTSEQKVELIEKLAELEHEQWLRWSQSVASRENLSDKTFNRWRLLWKEYENLSEEEKKSDRVWARKVLKVFDELNMEVVRK